MKKILSILGIVLLLPIVSSPIVNAGEIIYHYGDGTSGTTPPTPTQAAVGGFAVVNPETGVVHGVITGSVEYFSNNNRTINSDFMGCSASCQIIMQSTATQNGNVVGLRSQENGLSVIYDQNRNIFQVSEPNVTEGRLIVESTSNTLTTETEILVTRSAGTYEFGVQDLRNNTGQFQMTEVVPFQNTSAKIAAITKEYVCADREMLCARSTSGSTTILVDESVSFNERSTGTQVLEKVILEAKNKVKEQINLILTMLGKWIIE